MSFIFGILSVAAVASSLPVVDKGVFVITGVKTCRDGYGYCILGTDCTVDKEFIPDDQLGHCDGLKKAFTPRAFFVCCQSTENSTVPTTTTTSTTTTTMPPAPSLEELEEKSNESSSSSNSNADEDENSKESGEVALPPHVLQAIGINTSLSTTTGAPEAHTVIQKGEIEQELEQGDIPVETTTTTTTSSATVTSPTIPVTTPIPTSTAHTKCGYKATLYSVASELSASGQRIDGSRLAAQQTSLVCWTAAITRSSNGLQSLQDPGSFVCTGALISEDFVLTTATCVSRLFAQDLSLFRVALGSRHLVHPMNGVTADAVYRGISQLIVHEDYNIQGLFKRVNDIALIRLSSTTEESPGKSSLQSSYCTVCLPDPDEDHSGQDCIVTGFSHPTGSAASITEDTIASGNSDGTNAQQPGYSPPPRSSINAASTNRNLNKEYGRARIFIYQRVGMGMIGGFIRHFWVRLFILLV